MAASFTWPTGLAFAPDGSLYIADTGNHVIRRLRKGVITTFAGAQTPGKRDGDRRLARFAAPQGLACDGAGNLYVADFGNGIRRIAPDGMVTTLPLPSEGGKVLGVSALGAGSNLLLAYTEDDAVHLWSASGGLQTVRADDRVEPFEDVEYAAGSFYGVTILGSHAVAVTDVLHDVVRFVRFKAKPYRNYVASRVIAGQLREGDGAPGGFADGKAAISRVDVPLGIARLPDGTLVFTDSGNRRVRTISGIDPRGPVGPDLVGLYGPKDAYRVTVVGSSFDFWNVLWPESIAGRIESGLLAARTSLGKAPFVSTVRLDGTSVSDQASFVREHLGDGQADLVVMLIDDITQSHELDQFPGGAWRTVTPQRLRALARDLERRGTSLLVVVIPNARSVSLAEVPEIGAFNDGLVSALAFEQDNYRARQLAKFYTGIKGLHVLALQPAMERLEQTAGRYPLYYSRDIHLSPQGATFSGDTIAAELLRLKPWAKPTAL
jgi:DNA-binding beta-propeller fold protein YncE